jgi:hypothetical protein
MMRDNCPVTAGAWRHRFVAWRDFMSDGTRENDIDTTKASADLPGLDIDIIHRQAAHGDWEQISINLRATPSFDALGRVFETTDPFTLWTQAIRLIWMPWLVAAQAMMLPDVRMRTLPGRGQSRAADG